jgi:hypothetical protein
LFANSDLIPTRRLLRATTLLWQFLRIGYEPDLTDCLRAVDDLGPIEIGLDLQRALAKEPVGDLPPVTVEDGPASPIGPQPTAAGGQETERGGRKHRREIFESVTALGPDLPKLPFVRVLGLARSGRFVANNELTRADLDHGEKVSFRWFRHDPSSGELRLRLLARALAISPTILRDELQHLGEFAWRTSVVTPHHLHQQGTSGASDIRIAGSARGLWEVSIASPSAGMAQQALLELVNAFSVAAERLPDDGVVGFVTKELSTETLAIAPPSADFWRL